MRLDHIAYRVADRKKSAQFLIDAFGYRIQTEFDLEFEDNSTTKCIALEPPEKLDEMKKFEYSNPCYLYSKQEVMPTNDGFLDKMPKIEYHLAPEIFVSDGSDDSIVGRWVASRNGIGGIHHLAYEVKDVEKTMEEWTKNNWASFASSKPLTCPGLTQVFTEPHLLTGMIYEFIKRDGEFGFCADNVKRLMISTKENQ